MGFAGRTNHKMKVKKDEKLDKYMDLGSGLKKQWNMAVILIIVGALEQSPNNLEKRINELLIWGSLFPL